MNFFKIIIILLSFIFFTNLALSDSHDKEQNIVEKAKEINQKVKKDQAIKKANISDAVGKEEPLPLNDPFVGDGSLGGSNQVKLIAATEEERKDMWENRSFIDKMMQKNGSASREFVKRYNLKLLMWQL